MTDLEPPPHVAALLYADRTGVRAQVGHVTEQAREDGRWRELVGPVGDLLRDEQLDPFYRWVAAMALLEFADPAGHDAVVQACSAPTRVIWL